MILIWVFIWGHHERYRRDRVVRLYPIFLACASYVYGRGEWARSVAPLRAHILNGLPAKKKSDITSTSCLYALRLSCLGACGTSRMYRMGVRCVCVCGREASRPYTRSVVFWCLWHIAYKCYECI